MSTLPAPRVLSAAGQQTVPSELADWLTGGIVVGMTILVVGCLIAIIDCLLRSQHRHRHLVNLGMTPRHVAGLSARMFLVPYTISALVGLFAGLSLCSLIVGRGVPWPWGPISAVIGVTVSVAAAGTVLMAIGGRRDAIREPE